MPRSGRIRARSTSTNRSKRREVAVQKEHADRNGDRAGQRGARHAQRPTGAPPRNQDRCQDGVEQHGEHLQHHGRLGDAVAAQGRPHRDQRKLQSKRRQKPVQIGHPCRHGRGVRCHELEVGPRQHGPDAQHQQTGASGKHQTLVEHQVGVVPVLPPCRMGNQDHGTDPQHLGQRHHDELDVACCADTGNRRIAETRHEVEVDHQVEGLEHHADGQRDCETNDVLRNGADGEIVHR